MFADFISSFPSHYTTYPFPVRLPSGSVCRSRARPRWSFALAAPNPQPTRESRASGPLPQQDTAAVIHRPAPRRRFPPTLQGTNSKHGARLARAPFSAGGCLAGSFADGLRALKRPDVSREDPARGAPIWKEEPITAQKRPWPALSAYLLWYGTSAQVPYGYSVHILWSPLLANASIASALPLPRAPLCSGAKFRCPGFLRPFHVKVRHWRN